MFTSTTRSALALLLMACGSEPSRPRVDPEPVPQGELRRLAVRVAGGSATASSDRIRDAAQVLASSECPIHESSSRDVHLRGRIGASGFVEWMADDAAESELRTCLWDPFVRQSYAGPGDFEVRVTLAETPAPAPVSVTDASTLDWSGFRCVHSVPAHCPADHTCPANVWQAEACPAP